MVLGGCLLLVASTVATLVLYPPASGQPYGRLLVLRLLAIAAIAPASLRLLASGGEAARARAENVVIAAALVLALSFSAAGHAVDDRIPVVTLLADMTHLGAMALWLGGVLVLAVCSPAPNLSASTPAAVRRFSKLAAWLVGVVAVTGVWLASRALPSIDALWTSDYGRTLVAKLAIVAVLLLTAARARRAINWRLNGSPRRTLIVELAIAAVLLGVTSALVSAPRPEAEPARGRAAAQIAGGAPTSWKSISGASRRTVPSATASDISGNAKSDAA
jgi:copper transport protein